MKKLISILSLVLLTSIALAVDFPEFKSAIKGETLLQYLATTLQISEDLKQGKDGRALELRNRLDAIYSEYFLRFSPEIEKRLTENLLVISTKHGDEYVRGEALMALEIIQKQRSVTSYDEALRDENEHTNQATQKLIIKTITDMTK